MACHLRGIGEGVGGGDAYHVHAYATHVSPFGPYIMEGCFDLADQDQWMFCDTGLPTSGAFKSQVD